MQELVEKQLLGRQSGLVGPAISQIDPASRGGVELVPGWGTLGFKALVFSICVGKQFLGRQSGLVGPAISQIDPASRGGVKLVPGWGTLGF